MVFSVFPVLLSAQGVLVHTEDQMNRGRTVSGSHIGVEAYSSIEPVYTYDTLLRTRYLLPEDIPAEQSVPFYPRVKRMRDGRTVMFWQGGQHSSRIYCARTADLRNWDERVRLFGPEQKMVAGKKTWIRYMTADAVVLGSGEIVMAASFSSDRYAEGLGCGIVIRRSRYNGDWWDRPRVIYEGPNWEPYLIELPDGRLQCYFTDADPATKNSGTSMIESFDGGFTWSSRKRVCRQFKYYDRQQKIFTDQMPCFRLLADGKTLFGILEARLESGGPGTQSSYMMSAIWNDAYAWEDLGEDGEGPQTRKTNIFRGNGGYVAVFPSGEVAISAGIGGLLSVKLGDATAGSFNGRNWHSDWLQPFDRPGTWGTIETVDPHHLVWAMDCPDGLLFGVGYLNHRIDAVRQTVEIDGDGREWEAEDALFIGSESPVQAIFRASHDEDYVYVLAEVTGYVPGEEPVISMSLHDASAKKMAPGSTISFSVGVSGLAGSGTSGRNGSADGITVCSRRGKTVAGKPGYVAEISVPRKYVGSADELCFWAEMACGRTKDTFTGSNSSKTETWQRICLR